MVADVLRQQLTRAARGAFVVALALSAAGCATSAPPRAPVVASARPVTFVEDDAPRAMAEAKRAGKLVFVDAWAPWCHSCLSLRAFVLGDPRLAALDDRFVWLAVDTEKDQNAAFVAKYPNQVYPTLWVVDPLREEVVLQWPGNATVDELVALLDTASRAPAARSAETAKLEAAFLLANRALASGDDQAAAAAYVELVIDTPAGSPLLARHVEAAVTTLSSVEDHVRCAAVAATRGLGLPAGTSRATVLATGLACAREAKRETDAARLAEAVLSAAEDPDARVLADDRSALYEELVEHRKASGDTEGAKRAATAWAAFLEGAASKAGSSRARAVFDAHRLSAYLALGQAERALPMLAESERDFPDDYNPPARLARALLELGRLEEARAACTRAASRVYGPRALRVLALAADVAKARKDVAGERAALEDALARTRAARLTRGQQKLRASLETRLRALP